MFVKEVGLILTMLGPTLLGKVPHVVLGTCSNIEFNSSALKQYTRFWQQRITTASLTWDKPKIPEINKFETNNDADEDEEEEGGGGGGIAYL